eukprot:1377586-Amorphochlora_amoeboformis.AAC.1
MSSGVRLAARLRSTWRRSISRKASVDSFPRLKDLSTVKITFLADGGKRRIPVEAGQALSSHVFRGNDCSFMAQTVGSPVLRALEMSAGGGWAWEGLVESEWSWSDLPILFSSLNQS